MSNSPAPTVTTFHPEVTDRYIAQLLTGFELTPAETSIFHLTLVSRPDWHPENTCMFIQEFRERGNDGLLLLAALALSGVDSHPGSSQLDREHKLSKCGSVWDYIGLLNSFIAGESKDHWRDGNCASKVPTPDPKLTEDERCSKREHAESALGFLRLAAADTNPRKHAITYYTNLCLKYGATHDEVSAVLLGESEVAD